MLDYLFVLLNLLSGATFDIVQKPKPKPLPQPEPPDPTPTLD
jgi:hypothetical protein